MDAKFMDKMRSRVGNDIINLITQKCIPLCIFCGEYCEDSKAPYCQDCDEAIRYFHINFINDKYFMRSKKKELKTLRGKYLILSEEIKWANRDYYDFYVSIIDETNIIKLLFCFFMMTFLLLYTHYGYHVEVYGILIIHIISNCIYLFTNKKLLDEKRKIRKIILIMMHFFMIKTLLNYLWLISQIFLLMIFMTKKIIQFIKRVF